jgi:hypothetical protein
MIAVAAFYFGWALGARGGRKNLDEVSAALTSLRESEEFGALVLALRSHLVSTLHQTADWLQSSDKPASAVPDVLSWARELASHRANLPQAAE